MILIVDDDRAICASLKMLLTTARFQCTAVTEPAEAIAFVRSEKPDAVLLDMNFSRFTTGDEGLTLLKQMKILVPDMPVILMTAWGSIELAVEGIKSGAFDFITKPWDNRRIIQTVSTALELADKQKSRTIDSSFDRCGIIGDDAVLNNVLDTVARIAPTNASVLITGESGTGKELIAEAIHRNSPRRNKPFIKVNLGGMSQSLFESEMFGHVKGAFTDAVTDRVGRFEAANGGTIFLDEIGELDLGSQVKLLRVLQEQRFEPLGSNSTRKVDVRVVCATNADLPAMVAERTFREDLFYRINLVTLELPPLRNRKGDIATLAAHFAKDAAKRNNLEVPILDKSAIEFLASQNFPGNLREMKNLVERAILLSGSDKLTAEDFIRIAPTTPGSVHAEGKPLLDLMEQNEIIKALDRCNGNVSRAAVELGLSRQALYRRMEKFGLNDKSKTT
ncbi:MAG: sigma-54 dependent transcriptional regulator [Muribaculaceae bacterium]|nr:sigma-54 dependent transcriptional regulator [Muribaculaceae bacterium]